MIWNILFYLNLKSSCETHMHISFDPDIRSYFMVVAISWFVSTVLMNVSGEKKKRRAQWGLHCWNASYEWRQSWSLFAPPPLPSHIEVSASLGFVKSSLSCIDCKIFRYFRNVFIAKSYTDLDQTSEWFYESTTLLPRFNFSLLNCLGLGYSVTHKRFHCFAS